MAIFHPLSIKSTNYNLLVGTYTNTGKSKGIYSYNIDMKSAVFTPISVVEGVNNPSFLTITPDKKFVYSVSENGDASAATAFSFDSQTGMLAKINSANTKSGGPCNILATNKHVITANYGGGSISIFGRKENGELTDILQLIQHEGKSINNKSQTQPHVHQVLLTPDKKFIVVNDLGTDKIIVYKYNVDSTSNILVPFDSIKVKAGSGPRHSTFSKDGAFLYLVQELDGSVSVLKMKDGKLSLMQQTTLVRDNERVNSAADIHLSSDGKYLYVTNRGNANNISCFAVNSDGSISFKQQVSTGGKGPRNFAITPDDKFVLVGHQYTDNIVVFKRNTKSGLLHDTGKRIVIGAPVCLVFY